MHACVHGVVGTQSYCSINFSPYALQCRDSVREAPWQLEAEAKKQEILKSVIAAPKPKPKDEGTKESEAQQAQQSAMMEVDAPDMPP